MRLGEMGPRLLGLRERAVGQGPVLLVGASALLSALLVAASLLSPGGVPKLRALQADIARQEASNAALRRQNAGLERTARALGNPVDPKALEKAAREQLGYIRADELLFKFE